MSKKSKKHRNGVVYSTNNDYEYKYDDEDDSDVGTPHMNALKLYVSLDRKNRKGKDVTLVEGYKGNKAVLEALGKTLKTKCGSGGAVKDGEILIQGNHVLKVFDLLFKMGYTSVKKKGGGF